MTAAVEGSNEEQEGRHADDGDDEGQAEAVLIDLWRPFLPQLHVTDSGLPETQILSDRKQETRLPVSTPVCVGLLLLSPVPFICLPLACLYYQRTSSPEDTGLRTVQGKAPYLCQVIPSVLQQLIHGLRRKLRCGRDKRQMLPPGSSPERNGRGRGVPKRRMSCFYPSLSSLLGWWLSCIILGVSTPSTLLWHSLPHRVQSPHP